jgi:hypothetical protein
VKKGEPYWLPEDTDLALEWQAEQRSKCGGCGNPLDETSDPANVRLYEAQEIHCQACAVLTWRRNALSEATQENPDSQAGVHVYVTKRAGVPGG